MSKKLKKTKKAAKPFASRSDELQAKINAKAAQTAAIDKIMADVRKMLEAAIKMHGPMKSAHEGFAVLAEEVDELWDAVKRKKPRKKALRKEAIQVAAMGARFVLDVIGGK